jgi:hypothetical protein
MLLLMLAMPCSVNAYTWCNTGYYLSGTDCLPYYGGYTSSSSIPAGSFAHKGTTVTTSTPAGKAHNYIQATPQRPQAKSTLPLAPSGNTLLEVQPVARLAPQTNNARKVHSHPQARATSLTVQMENGDPRSPVLLATLVRAPLNQPSFQLVQILASTLRPQAMHHQPHLVLLVIIVPTRLDLTSGRVLPFSTPLHRLALALSLLRELTFPARRRPA